MADDSGIQPISETLILSALELIQLANRQGRRELNDRLIEALRAEVVSARPLEAGQELASTPELPEPPRAIDAPTPPLGPGAPIPPDPGPQSAPGPAEAEPGAGHPEAEPVPASTWPRPAEPVPPSGPAATDQAVPPAPSDNGRRPPPAPKRRGSGRQPAAVEPGDAALIEGFEAWLTEKVPRLDPKTIEGRVSFLRKLAFVANQTGRGLLEVDRALFEGAARSRFSASDYGRVIEGRASASAANTAKTAMANFVEYVRATGIGPDWADPTQGASLPKTASAGESDLFFLDCGAKKRQGSFPEGTVRQTVEWLWARYAKGTAYEGTRWHPHVARHTYATAHLDHGTELRVVQAQMGHEHAETTAITAEPGGDPALCGHPGRLR
ncbi:MAG: tyrosine-type recombinase/integrase [Acidimicrobiales bacterium]